MGRAMAVSLFCITLSALALMGCGVGSSEFHCSGPGAVCAPVAKILTAADPCPRGQREIRSKKSSKLTECFEAWVGPRDFICVPREEVRVRRECGPVGP